MTQTYALKIRSKAYALAVSMEESYYSESTCRETVIPTIHASCVHLNAVAKQKGNTQCSRHIEWKVKINHILTRTHQHTWQVKQEKALDLIQHTLHHFIHQTGQIKSHGFSWHVELLDHIIVDLESLKQVCSFVWGQFKQRLFDH